MTRKNQKEHLEKEAYGIMNPVGRDEYNTAGQKGFKASVMVEVWGFEYEGQEEIMVDGRTMAVYRTFGPKSNGRIELYAGERAGKA